MSRVFNPHFIAVFLLLSASRTVAQQTLPNIARVGASGIFVYAGETISDTKGTVTGYRIERRETSDKDFKQVALLNPTGSLGDFKTRMKESLSWLPYPLSIDGFRADSIWKKGKEAGTLTALKATGYSLPVMAGFNLVWLDKKAEKGKQYQYRVTALGTNTVLLSEEIIFKPEEVATLRIERNIYNLPQRTLFVYGAAAGKNKPTWITVYRSENGGPFEKVNARTFFTAVNDSFYYEIRDTTAIANRLYRFYFACFDGLGNPAPLSDTISAASLDFVQMPMPENVVTTADSTRNGVHISWNLPNSELLNMLTLYRSTSTVDGFEPVAVLSTDQKEFMDEGIKPATAYFYYFEAQYKTQEKAKRSSMFAGSFTDHHIPGRPTEITAAGIKNGVQLTWENNDETVSGFWLYRAETGQPFQQITSLIPASPGITQFSYTDTDSSLHGNRYYQYALKAYSSSHKESRFSDTVTARPEKVIPSPKAPLSVTVQQTDGVTWVSWDEMTSSDQSVAGFKVLRGKKQSGGKGSFVIDTIFCSNNMFADTLTVPNETYSYRVIALSVWGNESVPSETVYNSLAILAPAAPTGLTATAGDDGIRLFWQSSTSSISPTYAIYRYERGKTPVKIGAVLEKESYTDKSAAKGRQYFYFLRSSVNDRESEKSNEAMVRY